MGPPPDRRLVTVDVAAPLQTAGRRMLSIGTDAAVVVDRSGKPVGLLTLWDFLRASAAGVEAAHAPVRDWMDTQVPTAPPETPPRRIAEMLRGAGATHLVLVKKGSVVGIVAGSTLRNL